MHKYNSRECDGPGQCQGQGQEVEGEEGPEMVAGRVGQIRRQWAMHEDEAFAYRLQNEEISQHYCGNRSRNAIVREDAPKAREEQDKEEKEALEQRFHQLYLLQQQADEDERLAKELAGRYDMGLEAGSLLPMPSIQNPNFPLNNNNGHKKDPNPATIFQNVPRKQSQQLVQQQPPPSSSLKPEQRILNDFSDSSAHCSASTGKNSNFKNSNNSEFRATDNLVQTPLTSPSGSNHSSENSSRKTKSIIKLTSAYGMTEGAGAMAVAGSSRNLNCNSNSSGSSTSSPPLLAAAALAMEVNSDFDFDEETDSILNAHEERLLQEKLDEEVALKLQLELEKEEIDKRLAVEAQDRELAKVLHQKEKERLRRAKERAKQKAAALAASEGGGRDSSDLDHSGAGGCAGATIIGNMSARISPHGDEVHSNSSRTPSRSSVGSGGGGSSSEFKSPAKNSNSNGYPGPRVPEKTGSGSSGMRGEDFGIIGFRAAPKALPPQPQAAGGVAAGPAPRRQFVQGIGVGAIGGAGNINAAHHHHSNYPSRYEDYRVPGGQGQEPIPPYMPLQGLQNYSKKKNK